MRTSKKFVTLVCCFVNEAGAKFYSTFGTPIGDESLSITMDAAFEFAEEHEHNAAVDNQEAHNAGAAFWA